MGGACSNSKAKQEEARRQQEEEERRDKDRVEAEKARKKEQEEARVAEEKAAEEKRRRDEREAKERAEKEAERLANKTPTPPPIPPSEQLRMYAEQLKEDIDENGWHDTDDLKGRWNRDVPQQLGVHVFEIRDKRHWVDCEFKKGTLRVATQATDDLVAASAFAFDDDRPPSPGSENIPKEARDNKGKNRALWLLEDMPNDFEFGVEVTVDFRQISDRIPVSCQAGVVILDDDTGQHSIWGPLFSDPHEADECNFTVFADPMIAKKDDAGAAVNPFLEPKDYDWKDPVPPGQYKGWRRHAIKSQSLRDMHGIDVTQPLSIRLFRRLSGIECMVRTVPEDPSKMPMWTYIGTDSTVGMAGLFETNFECDKSGEDADEPYSPYRLGLGVHAWGEGSKYRELNTEAGSIGEDLNRVTFKFKNFKVLDDRWNLWRDAVCSLRMPEGYEGKDRRSLLTEDNVDNWALVTNGVLDHYQFVRGDVVSLQLKKVSDDEDEESRKEVMMLTYPPAQDEFSVETMVQIHDRNLYTQVGIVFYNDSQSVSTSCCWYSGYKEKLLSFRVEDCIYGQYKLYDLEDVVSDLGLNAPRETEKEKVEREGKEKAEGENVKGEGGEEREPKESGEEGSEKKSVEGEEAHDQQTEGKVEEGEGGTEGEGNNAGESTPKNNEGDSATPGAVEENASPKSSSAVDQPPGWTVLYLKVTKSFNQMQFFATTDAPANPNRRWVLGGTTEDSGQFYTTGNYKLGVIARRDADGQSDQCVFRIGEFHCSGWMYDEDRA